MWDGSTLPKTPVTILAGAPVRREHGSMRYESSVTEFSDRHRPGVLPGERAHLAGGARTSTLVTVTPCRTASVDASQLDQSALMELPGGHRREDVGRS